MPEKLETMVIYVSVPTAYKSRIATFRANALKQGIQINERETIMGLLELLDNPKISELLLKRLGKKSVVDVGIKNSVKSSKRNRELGHAIPTDLKPKKLKKIGGDK